MKEEVKSLKKETDELKVMLDLVQSGKKNKLFVIKNPSLKKCYKSHYFLCVGEKELYTRMNMGMKQFVNITSGTFVESAVWNLNDIEQVEITEDKQLLIDKVLNSKKTKDLIRMYKL